MRLSSILVEVWRNTRTGASHFAAFTIAALLAIGGLAVAEVLTVNGLVQRTQDYVNAGGDITIIATKPGQDEKHSLDGRACEALTNLPGVTAAGALRASKNTVTLAALPSTEYSTYDTSPGMREVLGLKGGKSAAGVWAPEPVASKIGLTPDSILTLKGGAKTPVAGVFDYPSDGRPLQISNALLTPITADNNFDECWVRSWPKVPGIPELANSLLAADADLETIVTTSGLNPSLAATFDGTTQFHQRVTAQAAPAAGILGVLLGFLAIRMRRKALAYHRHIGVPISAQFLQITLETITWIITFSALAATLTAFLATPNAFTPTWELGLRVITLGAAGAITGNLIALTTIREASLFRYVKE